MTANDATDHNGEKLKHYWAHGEGAAKIGWGVDGDFDRCVAELGKHLPPEEVKGYCANRHHDATGAWPGHAAGESAPRHKVGKNDLMHPVAILIEKIKPKEPWKPEFHGNQWTGGLGSKKPTAPGKQTHTVNIWTYGDGKKVPPWLSKMFDHIDAAPARTKAHVTADKKATAPGPNSGKPRKNRIGRGSPKDQQNRKAWLLNYFGNGKTVKCVHCHQTLDMQTVTPDRIDPIQSYAHENIVPSCLTDNVARQDVEIWTFLGIDPS